MLEWSLKLVFRINKHSATLEHAAELKSILVDVMNRFAINPHLTSVYLILSTLMVSCEDQESLRTIGKVLARHAYADQKELVRVANVKSVARLLLRLDLENNVCACLDIFQAVVLILNDEHPEIRSYLVQSAGVGKLIERTKYSIESPSLSGGSAEDAAAKAMVVDLNEPVLIESALHSALAAAKAPEEKLSVINDLLIPRLILSNPYREHHDKNYDEKIFFYEPINKYYDLLWMKKMAFRLIKAESQVSD